MTKKLCPAPMICPSLVELEEEPALNAHSCKRGLSTKLLIFAILFEAHCRSPPVSLLPSALFTRQSKPRPERTPGLLINAGLGAIPFVLVAITEGAKIPLTFGFFNASSVVWKVMVGLTLLAIAGITFETAATGFERAYTVRAAEVETLQRQLAETDRRIGDIKDQDATLSKRRAELVAQLEKIDAQELREIEQHTERCKAVGKRLQFEALYR